MLRAVHPPADFDSAVADCAAMVAREAAPAWVTEARRLALRNYLAQGLPGRKDEAWKYTPFRNWLAQPHLTRAASSALYAPAQVKAQTLADSGELARPLFGAETDPLLQLNQALAVDFRVLTIAAGVGVDEPIYLHHEAPGAGAMTHGMTLLRLEPDARATLVELVSAPQDGFSTHRLRIDLMPRARLHHIRIAEGSGAGLALWLDRADIAAHGTYAYTAVHACAAAMAVQADLRLHGEGAEAHTAAATLGAGRSHADWRARVSHFGPQTISRIHARSVLGGESFAAVQGCVSVAPAAQNTDSHQLAKALLVSPQARAVHKPELEIFADDVKCGHGATIGSLNPDQLFYLRARGIAEAEARQMLLAAFVGGIADDAPEGQVRDLITEAIARNLPRVLGEAAS